MRTLIVTHYFPPEIGAPQARLGDLARLWAEAGDEVTVLTCMPNHPTGVVPPEYRRKWRVVERIDGYRVIRTWVFATPNEGIVKKTLGHLSFMVSSVLLGTRTSGRPDVVVVSSPTFFSIFSAWAISRLKGARLVVDVRDLWPAIFVELGVLTNRRVIAVLEHLELWAYRNAASVVVVSNGFREDLIRRGVDADKVFTVRNGVDIDRYQPDEDPMPGRRQLGVGANETLVLYIGALGISHGLAAVVDAAALLRDRPIHFAFVGEGAAKRQVKQRVEQLGLENVSLHPGVPRADVPGLLAAADVCLVPLRDVPLFSAFIPSKIFEYFGAGKAVVGAVRGEPAEILDAGGALVVDPEAPAQLAQAIEDLANDPARRSQMGAQARRYVERHFDRRVLAAAYREILREDGRSVAGRR